MTSTGGTSAASGSGGTSGAAIGGQGGANAGTGGAAGRPPSGGSGGAAGSSGASDLDGGMSTDEDGGAAECVPPEQPADFSRSPRCSAELCPAQDSVCIQTVLLLSMTPQSTVDQLAKCDANNTCVPVTLANQLGRSLLTHCRSLNDAEGRCVSSCVPLVKSQADRLPRDVCTGADLCAPCYDPRTGEATGACSQGCDPGPTEPAKPFVECCSGRGLCVPPVVAGQQASQLARDSCSENLLCAPTELTDPAFKPPRCASLDGAEGRCLSNCVGGAVAKQRDRLPTAGCGAEEVCAPCYDPVTGEDTGACTVNGDKPADPAYKFPTCCGEGASAAGVCVSPELAGDQAEILRREDCGQDKLCAPTAKAQDPNFRFPVCYGPLGTGACVNACILQPAQAAILGRVSCAEGELCAPCTLLCAPTGACD
ncbi:MAG: hypothetical protein ABW321_14095 [Polyangiales bacterium]